MEKTPIPKEWNLRARRAKWYDTQGDMVEGARLGKRSLTLYTIREIERGRCSDINRLRPYLEMLGLELTIRELE